MTDHTTKSPTRRAISVAIATIIMLCLGVPAYSLFRRANLTGEESGQRQLLADVQRELETHRIDHGAYPRKLSEIQITTFRDGASPAMLQQLRYDSDGTTYTLSCFGVATRETITIRPATR